MAPDRYNCYFSFWAIFCLPPLPPNSPKNQNEKKMKKKHGDIIILHMCTKNYDQIVPEIWCTTDGQTEKVAYRGGCPT